VNLSPTEFTTLRGLVHDLCGLALSADKGYLLRHRLGPVARAAGCHSFAEFLHKLAGPDGLAFREPIIEAITTKETAFFRDQHPFDAFRHDLLPQLAALIRQRRAGRQLARVRTWCAAVATGQEAYTLAMLTDDFLRTESARDLRAGDFAILGTDISARVLEKARAGRYQDREVVRTVRPVFLQRYFRREGAEWVIDDRLRAMVEFRRVNLMDDITGLGFFDVILCRNVLIYFDEAARRRICQHFAEMLPPGGLLILGAVENLYGITTHFTSLALGETVVYRKV
jgi:chemotaxis protein methyltransferase CheR